MKAAPATGRRCASATQSRARPQHRASPAHYAADPLAPASALSARPRAATQSLSGARHAARCASVHIVPLNQTTIVTAGSDRDQAHRPTQTGSLVQAGAATLDMAAPLAARLKQFGWHIQFNMPAEHMRDAEDVLAKLPVRIVFDHMGHIPQPAGPADPSFEALRRLLDKGNTWVKLTGPYLDTKQG